MKIDLSNLLKFNYLPYNGKAFFPNNTSYITSSQKVFEDRYGKRYFITVNIFRPTTLITTNDPSIINEVKFLYEAEVQFKIENQLFNVNYIVNEESTIESMESFFNKLWYTMGCNYYHFTMGG